MTKREEYIGGIRKELKEAFETLHTVHEKLRNISELVYGLQNLEVNND